MDTNSPNVISAMPLGWTMDQHHVGRPFFIYRWNTERRNAFSLLSAWILRVKLRRILWVLIDNRLWRADGRIGSGGIEGEPVCSRSRRCAICRLREARSLLIIFALLLRFSSLKSRLRGNNAIPSLSVTPPAIIVTRNDSLVNGGLVKSLHEVRRKKLLFFINHSLNIHWRFSRDCTLIKQLPPYFSGPV